MHLLRAYLLDGDANPYSLQISTKKIRSYVESALDYDNAHKFTWYTINIYHSKAYRLFYISLLTRKIRRF